ncbi:hypothetical protein GGS20DRAFT_583036 [Poronia punctata]|nr:hypothetical protein GGS20DRAFT_583036 [Poronia punctata]
MSGTSSPRSGRPLTTSYADLMKPDEDWRNLPDATERRKIQNRLAQRAYRRNMRDRTKEVEKLKKQLQELQEVVGGDAPATLSSEQEYPSGGRSPVSSEGTPVPSSADAVFGPLASSGPDSVSPDYMHAWSHSQSRDHLSGLGMMSTGDPHMAYDAQGAYFSQIQAHEDMVAEMSTSSFRVRRTRALTTGVAPSSLQRHSSPRSHSISAAYPSNSSSSGHWDANGAEGQDSLSMSAGPYSMYCSADELSLYHPDSVYSLEDSLTASTTYATSPDSDLRGTSDWPAGDKNSKPHPSTFTSNSNLADLPGMPKSLPETTAPLLHFAVAGGNAETLRLLLMRHDVDVNGKDDTGYTSLQRAVMSGRTDMAAMLLERGATVEGNENNVKMEY